MRWNSDGKHDRGQIVITVLVLTIGVSFISACDSGVDEGCKPAPVIIVSVPDTTLLAEGDSLRLDVRDLKLFASAYNEPLRVEAISSDTATAVVRQDCSNGNDVTIIPVAEGAAQITIRAAAIRVASRLSD